MSTSGSSSPRALWPAGLAVVVLLGLVLLALRAAQTDDRAPPMGAGSGSGSGATASVRTTPARPGSPKPSAQGTATGTARLDEVDTLRGQVNPDAGPPRPRSGALRASVVGGGENAYSRGRIDVSWHDGDRVRFGADFLLPAGFARSLQGQVDLMRWDDFPTVPGQTHRSGVVIFAGDRHAHLVRQRLGVEEVPITEPFDLPEGRWFRLDVTQRLADDGSAVNEVRIDGRLVADSREPNTYGNGVDRVRFGVVAVDAAHQERPLKLWFAQPEAVPRP